MTFYDDLVNVIVRIMRDDANTSNKCPTFNKRKGSDIHSG